MAATTQRQTAVALNPTSWVIGDYRFWESTDPGVILYARNTVTLATDASGRPIAAVTRYLAWDGEVFTTISGAATLGVAGVADAVLPDRSREEDWTRVLASRGYSGVAPGESPRYFPLPVRDLSLTAQIDPREGTVQADPGGTILRLELTPAGITAWSDAMSGTHQVSGSARLTYSYPQLMEPRTATAFLHGAKAYTVLAGLLDRAADGRLTGSPTEVRDAWDELVRTEAIDVSFDGDSEPDPVTRDGLLGQVREHLFPSLFVPKDVEAAAYAFRWTRPTDVPDFPLSISVGGWTHLTRSLECRMADLVSELGPWAIHDVHETASVPTTVTVAPCDVVDAIAVSLDFGDVQPPSVMDFGRAGGSRTVIVATSKPQDLAIRHLTRANFAAPDWPVVSVTGSVTAANTEIRIDPEKWVGRHELVLCVVQGGEVSVSALAADDSVAASIRFEHPLFSSAISSSTLLDPLAPVEFSHPMPASGGPGRCAIEVVGSVGGNLVHGKGVIRDDEFTVFVIVETGTVRFVDASTLSREPDRLVRQLRARSGAVDLTEGARPESERVPLVSLDVATIAQPTAVSGWAAALAMVVSARDTSPVSPESAAARAGMDVRSAYDWPRIENAVSAWELTSSPFRLSGPREWATVLRRSGPVWLLDTRAVYDGIVVSGVSGDGTPDGTWLRVIEPWPVRVGTARTRTFEDLQHQFGGRAAERTVMVHR